ncbi:MAG: T9SS type A sorting domain-containing protein [Bacteroidetes bacterium]|nr:T9SS type A sorting domain-containing protein [Bacteroidota bacterium]
MKKLLLSIGAATLISVSAFAQIPNSGFENWTTVGSYTNPTSWGTMNNATATYSIYTSAAGTPGSPGSYYLKLTSKTTGTTVTNGIAVSGVIDSVNMKAKSGFPYNMQPVSLTGKWQHMIYGSSQGSVKAILTKWNVGLSKRDTIATAAQTLAGMAMSWANFTINFTYLSGAMPDSCIIELKASGSNPTNNDYLWVDNLAFVGSVTGIQKQESFLNGLGVYPNPSTESLNMNLNLKSQQQITIELVDMNGKLVRSKNVGIVQGESTQTINVAGLAKGCYSIKVIGEQAIEIRKIVIE